jgi:alpha-amylase
VYTSLRTTLLAAACAVGLALPLAPAHAAEDPGQRIAQHSLRTALTDQNFYFVMGDRFEDGDPSNNTGGIPGEVNDHGFDPTNKGMYQGGDLAGLTSKLDYIQGLGTTAIWLTPIFKNKAVQPEDGPSAGYHGYWITDFTQVDPHLGTNAELGELVDEAHARGMKVFFDIITNHTADVIGYEEGARTAYVPKDTEPYRTASGTPFDDRDYAGTGTFPPLDADVSFPYKPVLDPGEEDLKSPAWLNDETMYHNRGNTTFTGEDSQYGDFFGLDDLFTERPEVVDGMERIYKTWVHDFGIDGFRIDTVKHVDDEFWQEFGPGLLDYAHKQGKKNFFMFGEVYEDELTAGDRAFLSRYTTHNKLQAVLDFGFQTAARGFASKSEPTRQLARFFRQDDWYTDRNSNAYQLPTFLGNHDMGRFGHFVSSDNGGAGEPELLARDRLAHQLMFLSRGNPVVYYGDEQGFTGTGGDQVARQTMFASQVPEYLDDDLLGTASTHAQDNFDTEHPLYRAIARLARLTERHPALRNGAQQVRLASDGPGLFALSRLDRRTGREYVVVLNNSETTKSGSVPTYIADRTFRRLYGSGDDQVTTDRKRRLDVTAPPLSALVYASRGHIPTSERAPAIRLGQPMPADVARGRIRVPADVSGHSFAEVTFQAKVGQGRWRSIGTDDSRRFRVFHDVSDLAPGRTVRYRAVVLDNAGHTRMSDVRRTEVPSPSITLTSPAPGSVAAVYPVTVTAAVDPERPSQSVRFQRSIDGGDWSNIGTDASSPVYTVTDDISDLALGTVVRYRAILLEPPYRRVVSAPVRVRVGEPEPSRDSVTVAGSLQSEMGCATDWDPACTESRLVFSTEDGLWHGDFALPAGSYQWKVAIDGSWDENYGAGGAAGGSNLDLVVPEGGATYRFTWDPISKVPSAEQVSP